MWHLLTSALYLRYHIKKYESFFAVRGCSKAKDAEKAADEAAHDEYRAAHETQKKRRVDSIAKWEFLTPNIIPTPFGLNLNLPPSSTELF